MAFFGPSPNSDELKELEEICRERKAEGEFELCRPILSNQISRQLSMCLWCTFNNPQNWKKFVNIEKSWTSSRFWQTFWTRAIVLVAKLRMGEYNMVSETWWRKSGCLFPLLMAVILHRCAKRKSILVFLSQISLWAVAAGSLVANGWSRPFGTPNFALLLW